MMIARDSSVGTALWDAVEALVSAMNARNGMFDHSVRVACYAVQVAEAGGWKEEALEQIRLGALLHDIGQISWPDDLLCKQGAPLTEEERKVIESHTYKGLELIKEWPSLDFVRPYVLYHQEWIDGSGYPYGISGDALPAEVQIVSLADVYEALSHPRAYKKRAGFSSPETIEIMGTMKGKRWKAELFDLFAGVARSWP